MRKKLLYLLFLLSACQSKDNLHAGPALQDTPIQMMLFLNDTLYFFRQPDIILQNYSLDLNHKGLMLSTGPNQGFCLRVQHDSLGRLVFDDCYGRFFSRYSWTDTTLEGVDMKYAELQLTDSILDNITGKMTYDGYFRISMHSTSTFSADYYSVYGSFIRISL